MRVRIAVLADFVQIVQPNKLNLLGIFSRIMSQAEPIVHPHLELVVQLEFQPAEAGPKEAKIVLLDEDGRELLNLAGQLQVPRGEHGEPVTINQIIPFQNLSLPKFGHYEFQILVNGRMEAEVPLDIVRAIPPGQYQA